MKDSQGETLRTISQCIGNTTNNQAEYRALIAGLQLAASLAAPGVEVRLDSELLVRQLCGQYKVRSAALFPLYREASRLLCAFASAKVTHIPRELNRAADALANAALNAAKP